MELQVGQQIGSYRIISEIARGAYAYVYKAAHIMLDERIVALKLLHTTFIGTEGKTDILSQEAHILEHLQHPHILAMIDFNVYEGYPYLVKEFAPNGSLRDRLRKLHGKAMPAHQALSLLRQISDGLLFAHQQHVVHCDLKPENILFNANDEALIADFDIAQVLKTARSRASSLGGTPSYMSPEQFHGKVNSASDQYALACMAYEMLTGQRPFEGKDQDEIRYLHLHKDPMLPTQVNPALPFHMDQVLLRALARNDHDRFPDVGTFIAELDPPYQSLPAEGQWTVPGGPHLILSEHPVPRKGKKDASPVDNEIYYEDTVAWNKDKDEATLVDVVLTKAPRTRRTVKKSSAVTSAGRKTPHSSGRQQIEKEAPKKRGKSTAAASDRTTSEHRTSQTNKAVVAKRGRKSDAVPEEKKQTTKTSSSTPVHKVAKAGTHHSDVANGSSTSHNVTHKDEPVKGATTRKQSSTKESTTKKKTPPVAAKATTHKRTSREATDIR